MIKKALAIFLLVALFGCAPKKQNAEAERPDLYFDIEQLLDAQQGLLADETLTLNKRVTINGETESFEAVIANEKEWKSQFQLFYAANINKFGLVDAYNKETLAVGDGITKDIYTSKSPKNLVQVIECAYQNESLTEVRVQTKDNNIIYKVENEYLLRFNQGLLTSYTITANESMILKKDMQMEMVAEIVH